MILSFRLVLSLVSAHLVPIRNHLVRTTEHWSRSGTIRLSDQPFALHDVENCSRASVSDSQSSLKHGCRGSLHLHTNAKCFFKQLVMFAFRRFEAERFFF